MLQVCTVLETWSSKLREEGGEENAVENVDPTRDGVRRENCLVRGS